MNKSGMLRPGKARNMQQPCESRQDQKMKRVRKSGPCDSNISSLTPTVLGVSAVNSLRITLDLSKSENSGPLQQMCKGISLQSRTPSWAPASNFRGTNSK
jgi:hypothetical protein